MRGHGKAVVGMTPAPTLPRDLLAAALGNPRLVAAFEQQSLVVAETQEATGTNAEATNALQDASFLVLAPNSTLTAERVFTAGDGIATQDADGKFTVSVSDAVAHVEGGFRVQFTAQGGTSLVLPLTGTLATRSGTETLQNKTLYAPRLDGLGDFVDDAAAATGGVPIGGVYRTASALKVRVA